MLAGLDIILIFISVVCGAGIGYYIRKQRALQATNSAEAKAEKIVTEEKAKERIKNIQLEQLAKLESIAKLDRAEAEARLLRFVETDVSDELASRIKKLEQKSSQEIEEKTKAMMAIA